MQLIAKTPEQKLLHVACLIPTSKIPLSIREQRVMTNRILLTLTFRERKVLSLRYGLDDESIHTLEEVATIFNTTMEEVRQIETKAIMRLQKRTHIHKLEEFLDGSR